MAIVTLVSGGFDSTLMSLMAFDEGVSLFPLFINYGQLAADREWSACQLLHKTHGLPQPTRMEMSGFGKIVPSGITDNRLRINEDAFLPCRNLLFLVAGAAHACKVQAEAVAIGLLNPAFHLFPDQTPEFTSQAQQVIKAAVGYQIEILTPLANFSKADILKLAQQRGLQGTYSCHAGGETPCGRCIACIEIASAEGRS